MSVTIEVRRVAWAPEELQPKLKLKSFCVTCNTTKEPLRKCSNCKLVFYCCRDCQRQDWERHRREDECSAVKKIRRRLKQAEEEIRSRSLELIRHFVLEYPDEEDPFLGKYFSDETFERVVGGRGSFSLSEEEMEEGHAVFDMIDLLAGRFGEEPLTMEVMQSMMLLYGKVMDAAERHNMCYLWEHGLEIAVELKRLTPVSSPDIIDQSIPKILLKLHRDDDAIGYIVYWMDWRPREVVDYTVINANRGDWPFPCDKDCRLLDFTDEMRSCVFEDERLWFTLSFAIITLAIKLRYICLYRNLSSRADAFLGSAVGQSIPADIGTAIISSLTGGKHAAVACTHQVDGSYKLMDYINEEWPWTLQAVVDPNVLPTIHDEGAIEQAFDIRGFLEKYADGGPIINTLVELIQGRYS